MLRGTVSALGANSETYNIPGAALKLSGSSPGFTPLTAVSDDAGEYRFPDLNPGLYTLEVTAQGFATQTRKIMIRPGQTTVEDIRLEIAAVLRKYRLPFIEDDIYRFLVDAPPPLTAYLPELGHYLLGSSKGIAPGLRVGFLAVPQGQSAPFIAALRGTTWMAPPLSAEIAARWINDGTAAALGRAQREAAIERQKIARRILTGFDYRAHPNSFFGLLYMPANWRAPDLVSAAARQGIRLRAAEAFSTDQPAPQAIRLCICGLADVSRMIEGLGRIVALLHEGPTADNLLV